MAGPQPPAGVERSVGDQLPRNSEWGPGTARQGPGGGGGGGGAQRGGGGRRCAWARGGRRGLYVQTQRMPFCWNDWQHFPRWYLLTMVPALMQSVEGVRRGWGIAGGRGRVCVIPCLYCCCTLCL